MMSTKILQFSRPPTPLPIYVQNSSTLWPWTSNFKRNPPLNQSMKRKHNPRMNIYVIRSFLQVGFRFQYQLINLVWLSFDFFSFSWSLTIYFFVALYSCVCSCPRVPNVFYLKLFTFLVLLLQSTCLFAQFENQNKLWNNNSAVHVNQQNQNKKQNQVMSYSNWPRVLLFDLAHKQCNGIIKGWLHYLTSEPKGRFLVNNTLMFGSWYLVMAGSAWCLVMAQIQFSLLKKK